MIAPWPHDPRALARAVLAQPRYRAALAPPASGGSAWDGVLRWLLGLWRALTAPLAHLRGGERTAQIVAFALIFALLGALAFGLVHLASGRRARRRRAAAGAAHEPRAPGVPTAAELNARALGAMQAGRRREAAALWWLSALRALDERGRVPFDASRTPGEWRRLVGDAAFEAFARDAVVALFDAGAPDAALLARLRDGYDRVVST